MFQNRSHGWLGPRASRLPSYKRRKRSLKPRASLGMESLEDRQLMAVVTWNTNSSGSWDDANNWLDQTTLSPRVPNGSDEVVIDRASANPTVTIGAGAHAAFSLRVADALALAGGSLDIGSTTQIDVGGTIDLQGDVTLGGNGQINNLGTLRKSSGSGESVLNKQLNNNAGTIEVLAGHLSLSNGGLWSNGGTLNAGPAGALVLKGPIAYEMFGGYSGSGGGRIEIATNFGISDPGTQPDATFNFPAGMLHWTGGSMSVAFNRQLTNLGSMTLSGSGNRHVGGNDFINAGTLILTEGTMSGGIITNQAGAVFDFQGDGDLTSGQFYNFGTMRKSAGTGESRIGWDFNQTGGTIDVQSGKLTLTGGTRDGGTISVASGAVLDLTGGANPTFKGIFTGTGAGRVELSSGNINTDVPGVTFNMAAGLFHWSGGSIFAHSSRPFTNAATGSITIDGAGGKGLSGDLKNLGSIVHTDGALSLGMLINEIGGSYQLEGATATVTGGAFVNRGTLRKATDALDTTTFSAPLENEAGIIEAAQGRLKLAGGGRWQGATLNTAANAVIEIAEGVAVIGTIAGSGAGRVEFTNGTLGSYDFGVSGGFGTLDFPPDYFYWLAGGISSGGCGSFVGCGTTLVNAGSITIDGPLGKGIGGTGIINTGSIINKGTGDFSTSGSVFDNRAGATYEHRGDSVFSGSDQFGNAGRFINAGKIVKSAGAGTVDINTRLENTATGEIEVQAGRLKFSRGGSSSGGTFKTSLASVLEFAGGDGFNMTGSYTGSGAGTIEFKSSLNGGDDLAITHLNFPDGYFHMINGGWSGSIQNDGTIYVEGDDILFVRAHFINAGTILHTGTLDLNLNANTFFENQGLYDVQSDADLVVPGDASGGAMRFKNTGVLRKSAGSGTTEVRHDGSGKTFQLDNTGIVEVRSGTVSILDPVVQLTGATLSAGTWNALNGSTLAIVPGSDITTNLGNVTLDGAGATFAKINALANNQGSFTIDNGRDFTTIGNLTNSGHLTVGAGSALTVNGTLTESGGPSTLSIKIGGRPATGLFGQVTTTGAATFDGVLAVELADGFGPSTGDAYQILTYPSQVGSFDLITGIVPFFSAIVDATNTTLTSITSATNIKTDSISVPAGGAVGQAVSIPFTIVNEDAEVIAGNWTDSIYLSRDLVFGSDDVLLARVPHTSGLGPNGSYTATADAPLPAVVDGDYHVVVVADSRHQVNDTNRADNTLVSTATLHVTVPSLQFDAPQLHSIQFGADEYFRLDVPAGGNDVVLAGDFVVPNEAELLVGYNRIPSPGNFDFSAPDLSQLHRTITIARPQAGSYYILVRGREGAVTPQNYTLSARIATFEVRSITPNHGSNLGSVTITVHGSDFTPDSTVRLVAPDTTTRSATTIRYRDSNTLLATFDLRGLTASAGYDVRVANGTNTVTLADQFAVTTGVPGAIQVDLIVPSIARAGREIPVTVEYENIGQTDITSPIILIESDNAFFHFAGQSDLHDGIIPVLAVNPVGQGGVLAPGARGTLTVLAVPKVSGAHVISNFAVGVPKANEVMDWSALKAQMKPASVPADAWDAIFANFTAKVGNTYGQLGAVLAADATYLSELGQPTADVGKLIGFELGLADPGGSISRRYTLGPLGRGVSSPELFSLLATADRAQVTVLTADGGARAFTRQTDGTYRGQTGDHGRLTYDGTSFRLVETDGRVIAFRPDGRWDFSQDSSGQKLTAAYSSGRLTSLTQSNGDTTTFTYNAAGRISRAVDAVGRITDYAYDASGQHLVSVTDSQGDTLYSYVTGQGAAREHALASVTYPDGSHLFFQYDALGRMIRQNRDGGAETITYAYSSTGEIFVTANGATTVISLDANNHVSRLVDPDSGVSSNYHDSSLNLVTINLPGGRTTTVTYDGQGNPVTLTNALGQSIGMAYTSSPNRLNAHTDSRGNTVTYAYDASGNITEIGYLDGSNEQFVYNSLAQVTLYTDRLGQSTTYTSNSSSHLLESKLFQDGSRQDFQYDAHRNLTQATYTVGGDVRTTTFEYDSADRLTKVTYPGGKFLQYQYDAGGRRTQMTDLNGYTVNYEYDATGRLLRLRDGANQLIDEYTYDARGRVAREDKGSGSYSTYEYDELDRLIRQIDFKPDDTILEQLDYEYDSAGRPASVTSSEGTTTYEYDATSQLTAVFLPDGRTIRYTYDAAGNRTTVNDDNQITSYSTNNLNQYSSSGNATFVHDAAGNLISRTDAIGVTTYSYDAERRLVEIISPTDTWQFEYDALGNRIASIRNGQRTDYLTDPFGLTELVGEFDAGGRIASYVHGLGLEERVAGGSAAYYSFDSSGNTILLTGDAGQVLNSYSYLPFGEIRQSTEVVANPFQFVGKFGVSNTGLSYMRNRYYDASTGRFTQPDPVGLAGGDANWYRYVGNSPVDRQDPSGLWWGNALLAANIASKSALINNSAKAALASAAAAIGSGIAVAGLDLAVLPSLGASELMLGNGLRALAAGGARSNFLAAEFFAVYAISRHFLEGSAIDRNVQDLFHRKFFKDRYQDPSQGLNGDKLGAFEVECLERYGTLDVDLCIDLMREKRNEQLAGFDPNNIIGPAGFGVPGFLLPNALMPYTIEFENLPNASAPAQIVVVTQQLDADLDWSTFQLGDFGFGGQTYDVPAGLTSYTTLIHMPAAANIGGDPLDVQVNASFNLQTGLVTWRFESLDPQTGDEPANPLAGFLPPNVSAPEGQGFFNYTVRSKADLTTGAKIDAQATIVFDTNDPIDTPAIFNTIDSGAPASSVDPLAAVINTDDFAVSWSSVDDDDGPAGSGAGSFDIFVSVDGGAFELWLDNTSATSATYSGEFGHSYAFYSVATDNVGHEESDSNESDTSTTLEALAQQALDFGDAPASYGTRLVDDGARHITGGSLYLGAGVDGERDGQPTDGASGDDVVGNFDDEDGVQLPRALFSHLGATANVFASQAGRLDAWIDFNANGEFEANEQIATSLNVAAGSNTIPIYVPASAAAGITYARFRLSSAGVLGPGDEAPDGEVEDYTIEIVVPRQPVAKVFDDPQFHGNRMWLIGGRYKDDVITVSAPDANGTVTARRGANLLGTANIGEFDRIVICGFDGDDTITIDPAITKSVYAYGGDGNDTITGGSGNDRLFGGEGKDRLYGEAGNDKLSGDNGPDRLYGGEGDDKINAGEGDDKLLGRAGIDRLYAGAGNDILYGDEGDDYLSGEKGNDRLWGGNDADVLLGGKGVDWLYGDTGRDLLSGGLNADFVRGYDGDDILIAGYTSYDNFEANMLAIMAEWKSSRGYDERVANILTGNGPVLSDTGIQLVKGRSVFDDGEPDLALGFDDRDWFFASLTEDYQLDQHPDERLN